MTQLVTPARAPRTDRAGRSSPGALLAVVLTGQFMAALDSSVVNVAAPAIHADLRASGAALQLVIAGYVISYAVLLVTCARLGDIVGHRRMFLGGLVIFTLASLGCGLAGSAAVLVALRFVQGAGAGAMIPQVLSLIQRTFPGPARAAPMRLYAAVLSGGVVAGQIAGGLLVSAHLTGGAWRPVFLLNVPVGAAVLVAALWALPGGRGEPGRGLDPGGLVSLSVAVVALVVPLVLGQAAHWPAWVWACLAGSAAALAVFVMAERRVGAAGGAPLVPPRLLRMPGVALGIAALLSLMAVFGGFFFALALHLQGGLGYSALRAGLTFAPCGLAFALVSLNWQRLPGRGGGAQIIGGFAIESAGLLCLAAILRDGHGGFALYPVLALIGAGMAAAFSPLMTAVLARVPVADAADATGVIVTVNQLALVIGVATFGTLYLDLAGHLPPQADGGFRLASAHAIAVTCLALAAALAAGGVLAAVRSRSMRGRG